MDKFEYKVRAEEIKSLIAKGDYAQAAEIADTIDWRRVKSVMMLCVVSDLYKINKRYEDARDMLLLAYDRHPGARTIVYSLCELSIKMEEFVEAVEYYKEYVQIAPKDTGRYILQYKLYVAQDVSLEERIAVLEELKKRDYREKWAYELAYLYHRVGQSTRCVEECDELILWFGDGKYVIKALELKMLHQTLTPEQQQKYDYRFEPRYEQTEIKESIVEQEEEQSVQTQVEEDSEVIFRPDAEMEQEEVDDSVEETPENVQVEAETEEFDIHVKMVDVSQYNTINLQNELAEGLKEILDEEAYEQPQYRVSNPFEETLSMDPDGQIRLVMPEVKEEDAQIDGQMSIDDVMREWERLKKEAEFDMDMPDEAEEIAEIEEFTETEEIAEAEEILEELEEEQELLDDQEMQEEQEQPQEEMDSDEADENFPEAEVTFEEEIKEPEKPHIRNLSNEEKALFGSFIQNRSDKDKLITMLDKISMASYTGNVILTGGEGVDTLNLAKSIIRELQMTDSNFSGKTAKISGQALNQKDVAVLVDQMQNGALIIQKASEINEKTAAAMYRRLQRESQGIIIIMEDTKKNMNKFLAQNAMLEECFPARMDMEALSNEALVAFGKKYAREMEYSIDELGVLALHTRIEELQTIDHAVTIMEVKEIVDEAIRQANKKNIKHFFDILMAKRYDEEDMIILRENDFF